VIGEPVKRLSEDFRATHPQVPWKLIAATRDKLIHHYEGVDLEEVWTMVASDPPRLARHLRLQRSDCTRTAQDGLLLLEPAVSQQR
jgi:uncharacterized protein with HEPN domain